MDVSPEAIWSHLREVLGSSGSASIDGANDRDDFVEDLNIDSLDLIELSVRLEQHFALTIPDKDLRKLRSVEQTVAYLRTRLGGHT